MGDGFGGGWPDDRSDDRGRDLRRLRRTVALVGVLVVLGAACGGGGGEGQRSAAPTTATSTTATSTTATSSTATSTTTGSGPTSTTTLASSPKRPATVLAWTAGRLPDPLAPAVAASPEVAASTVVTGGSLSLVGSSAADGAEVDRTGDGRAIPLDTLAYDPATYRPFVSDVTADALASLGPDDAALGATSAKVRRLGVGGTLSVDSGRTLTVRAVLPDVEVAGAEVLVSPGAAADLGIAVPRFLLALPTGPLDEAVEAIRTAAAGGPPTRLRSSQDTDWLRHADAVAPQALVKRDFGEFSVGPAPGREVSIDPAWVDADIVTEAVPLLGEIRCHRRVMPNVRQALGAVEAAGLGDAVDADAFAGCFNARGISAGSALSRHSWGIALDLNVTGDARGRDVSFAPELVEAMADAGFRSGADWLVPDPAHFEFYPQPSLG